MASSKVMASSTSRNADLSRCTSSSTTKLSSISDHNNSNSNNNNNDKDNNNTLASMTVDGILKNIYSDTPSAESTLLNAEITLLDAPTTTSTSSTNEATNNTSIKESSSNFPNKTVDDVWKEIVAGERKVCKEEAPDEMMTLEDFLARAGAVEEEDVKMPPRAVSGGVFSSFDPIQTTPFQPGTLVEGFGNGVEVRGVGRGKRKAVVLEPLDKAAQQRQRRMIKNRESAARSRERKQAYQVELEALAVKLEEENDRLLKEKAERTKERFKLLMEKVIPVVEQRRPARTLRRVRSMHW